jgi:hypothetical protein
MLLEDPAEQLDRRQHLLRCERLLPDNQDAALDEGVVKGGTGLVRDRTRQIDAADLGTGMLGQGRDFRGRFLPDAADGRTNRGAGTSG